MKNVFSTEEPSLVRCGAKYSFFFDFMASELPGLNTAPLHRVCTLMRKMGVNCFVREELEHDAEIAAEIAALSLRAGVSLKGIAVRFTFFRRAPASSASDSWRELGDADILGYVVLLRLEPPLEFTREDGKKVYKHGYILEAVIAPPTVTLPSGKAACVTNYYMHCCQSFGTVVGTRKTGKAFNLVGTFFCQQNGYTNSCAHAALRMAVNSWPVHQGPKLTYEAINGMLKVDHAQLKGVQNDGLKARVLLELVEKLGYEATIADFVERPGINYEDYIYPLIESSCPVILGIASPTMAHVVAVVGHTLNSDRWAEARHRYGTVPGSDYLSASAWADHFIVNDDNFGMHVTLPSEAVKNIIVPKYNPNLYAAAAVGLLPEKLNKANPGPRNRVDGYVAERLAAMLVSKFLKVTAPVDSSRWFTLLRGAAHAPVCRTVLRDRVTYLGELSHMVDEVGNRVGEADQRVVEKLLPERFWVTEIMIPALYVGNKHKLGEILLATTATPMAFVFAWMAGEAWCGPDWVKGHRGWPVTGHVPLSRGVPASKCALEW